MLTFEESDEAFFDSVDSLSFERPVLEKEDTSEYQIWSCEPQSIRERRGRFLRDLGLVFDSEAEMASGSSSEIVDLGRIAECSGAVSGCCSSANDAEGDLICGREEDGEANVVNEVEHEQIGAIDMVDGRSQTGGTSTSAEACRCRELDAGADNLHPNSGGKKLSWWKRLITRRTALTDKIPKMNQLKVRQNNKSCMEFSAVYIEQEIRGHVGYIWAMKFSPDGQYLVSGGEDGVVRVRRVMAVDASSKSLTANLSERAREDNSMFRRKKSSHPSVVIPEKVFQIEESPLHEFYGHTSDVLDLAWSNSNCLLSSSKDKTVRLWKVGCNECLNVFSHSNYVTCIQFNPVDENCFISGSVDGKVRIWGVAERRVVDWVDVHDIVTAVCYKPRGKGFVVGSIRGTCRFYEASGNHHQLGAKIHVQGRRRTSSSKITGIQFSLQEPERVMITSEDSRVRVYDGIDVVRKYKAFRKSGCQMSASFTSTGKHIISVGEDSRVYVWNYDGSSVQSKHKKAIRSCEHFSSEGVSVAIPWSSMGNEEKGTFHHFQQDYHQKSASSVRESERFSLGNWFSTDGPSRRSTTWPEEKLPLWGSPPVAEPDHSRLRDSNSFRYSAPSATWGLVIVAASWDGTIRTFHNYGLPVKL